MLTFATANNFLQLNLVFIADSRTGFRTRLLWKYELNFRNSRWSCSVKKGVLTILHLCCILFLIESSGLQLNLMVSPTQVFFCGIWRTSANDCFWNLFKSHQDCLFLTTYTSGSDWYIICFSFCIIIQIFICQFFFLLIMLWSEAVARWCSAKKVLL